MSRNAQGTWDASEGYRCGGSCVLYECTETGALDMCGFTILGVDQGFLI